MPHNPFGIATTAFLALFFPAVGILASIRNRRAFRRLKAEQLKRILPTAPIAHVHEINADRSNVMLTDSGAIFCRCCVAGCDEGVFIGGDVAALWKSQQMPAQPVGPTSLLSWQNTGRHPWI